LVAHVSLMTKSSKQMWGSGLRQQLEDFLCCGFRCTGKAMGQCIRLFWKIRI
jgi:hypothetical protein